MEIKLDDIVEKYTANIPTQVNIKLPKLKKDSDNKGPEKIKLPKLKKVTSEGEVYAENSQ